MVGRREDALAEVAGACLKAGAGAAAVHTGVCDVSKAADVERVFSDYKAKQAQAHLPASLDVLVCNAGLSRLGFVEDVSEEDFDDVFDTNVKGVWLFLKHALPVMKAQGKGQVIVTSSVMGFRSAARSSLYCASKHALQGMVGSVRAELKMIGSRVKVGTVNPGAIATPWWTDPSRGGKRDKIPDLATMLTPEAVAEAILMMARQPESSDMDHILLEPAVPAPPAQEEAGGAAVAAAAGAASSSSGGVGK